MSAPRVSHWYTGSTKPVACPDCGERGMARQATDGLRVYWNLKCETCDKWHALDTGELLTDAERAAAGSVRARGTPPPVPTSAENDRL